MRTEKKLENIPLRSTESPEPSPWIASAPVSELQKKNTCIAPSNCQMWYRSSQYQNYKTCKQSFKIFAPYDRLNGHMWCRTSQYKSNEKMQYFKKIVPSELSNVVQITPAPSPASQSLLVEWRHILDTQLSRIFVGFDGRLYYDVLYRISSSVPSHWTSSMMKLFGTFPKWDLLVGTPPG